MDAQTIAFTKPFTLNMQVIHTMRSIRAKQDRQHALKESLEVFWRRGVNRTTMEDIAREADVSFQYLRENFCTPLELYKDAVMWYLDQYGRQLLSEFALHSNPTEALRGALYECIGLFCNKENDHARLLSYALAAVNNSDPILISGLLELRRKVYATILVKLEGSKSHLIETANIPILARFYLTTLRGLASQAADGIAAEELYRVADLSLEILESYRKVH